ncbi:hypothetical protein ABZ883_11115 [Streptomyces sp. NPDC046977]|uniref:hypothetical protein n=1 Tax=Streptomyces sp. NPDC046977 TaxID=3154703 RepID=UPI0033EA7D8D
MRATADDKRWNEAERAVRLLLRDTVPQPATPADRLVRVRLRIRRRRRRRGAAIGAAASLAAAAALAVVLPGPGSPQVVTDRATPAGPPPPASSAPALSPSATRDPGLTTVRLPVLSGLTLRVPRGWRALDVTDPKGNRVGYVSSQPLTAPAHAVCGGSADQVLADCAPLASLDEGGVLMLFRYDGAGGTSDTTPLRMGGAAPAGKGCRVLRGTTGTTGWGHGRSAPFDKPFEVSVSVCMRAPSDGTLAAVTKALETAFPQGG